MSEASETKISSLSGMNIRALGQVKSEPELSPFIQLTATTATFPWPPAETLTRLRNLVDRLPTGSGSPRASLWAVLRRLEGAAAAAKAANGKTAKAASKTRSAPKPAAAAPKPAPAGEPAKATNQSPPQQREAKVHRTAGGRTGLQQKIVDYLAASGPSTPSRIGRAIGHSSGAVQAALVRLTTLGTTRQTNPKPKEWGLAG